MKKTILIPFLMLSFLFLADGIIYYYYEYIIKNKNYMRTKNFYILLIMVGMLTTTSCKKDKTKSDCFPTTPTLRKIVDKPAVIRKQPNGAFFIVEERTIDTQLKPCYLKPEFQFDNLKVIVSGDEKGLAQPNPGPCCVNDFIITEISRQ